MYDYYADVCDCVWRYIKEYVDFDDFEDFEDLEEYLNKVLWTEKSVTGNDSLDVSYTHGSYTHDTDTSMKYVSENLGFLTEALNSLWEQNSYIESEIGERFLSGDWNWFDVMARCYCLKDAIHFVLEEYFLDEFEDDNKNNQKEN